MPGNVIRFGRAVVAHRKLDGGVGLQSDPQPQPVQIHAGDVRPLPADLVEKGLSKLEWLVVRDFAMTESANWWERGRLVEKGEHRPEDIGTEVFFLPAAMPGEKDGTVTNTSRLVQWHDVVLEAPGDSRSDLWFIHHLGTGEGPRGEYPVVNGYFRALRGTAPEHAPQPWPGTR